jgi:hypothetical protein
MAVYVEFPVDLLRKIVLPKKGDEGGGGGEGDPLCFTYGTGAIMAAFQGIIAPVPYGPLLFPPFVGYIDTPANRAGTSPGHIPAAGGLNGTISLQIWSTFINFTTAQLVELSQQINPNDIMFYQVSMIQTFEVVGYRINMAWSSAFADPTGLVGLGITDIPAATGGPVPPPSPPATPVAVMGTMDGGSGSYTLTYNHPVQLWTLGNRGAGWTGTAGFMDNLLHGEGDWYTWSIDAICGPSLVPG